jgi:hypothetical protein
MSFNEDFEIKEEFDIKEEFQILNEMGNNKELTIKKEIVEEASVLGTSTAFLDIVQIKCEPEMPSFSDDEEISSDDQDSQSLRKHHKRRRKVKMSKIKKSKFFLSKTLSREDGLISGGKLVSKKQVRSYQRDCVNGYNFCCLNSVRLG